MLVTSDFYPIKQKGRTKERDEYLLANTGIDSALLANDLGLSESFVQRYQRKLGIRLCKNTPRKGKQSET